MRRENTYLCVARSAGKPLSAEGNAQSRKHAGDADGKAQQVCCDEQRNLCSRMHIVLDDDLQAEGGVPKGGDQQQDHEERRQRRSRSTAGMS